MRYICLKCGAVTTSEGRLGEIECRNDKCKSKDLKAATEFVLPEAIGLEYETDIEIVCEGLRYQDVILEFPETPWCISADGVQGKRGVMEFVTAPLFSVEEVLAVHKDIWSFLTELDAICSKPSPPQSWPEVIALIGETKSFASRIKGATIAKVAWVPPKTCAVKKLLAAPQITVGVPLCKVYDLLTKARKFSLLEHLLAKATTKDQQSFLFEELTRATYDPLKAAALWRARLDQLKPVMGVSKEDADAAQGLMSLVLTALLDGDRQVGAADYAKGILSLLHRVDYHSMYKKLGKAQAWFTLGSVLYCWALEAEPDKPMSWEEISNCSELQHKDRNKPSSYWKHCFVFPQGYKAEADIGHLKKKLLYGKKHLSDFELALHKLSKPILCGPSIGEWISSIIDPSTAPDHLAAWDPLVVALYAETHTPVQLKKLKGSDLLSRGMCAFNSVSLGRLDMRGDIVVLEFRKWPGKSLDIERCGFLAKRLCTDLLCTLGGPSKEVLDLDVMGAKRVSFFARSGRCDCKGEVKSDRRGICLACHRARGQ